jgi:galactan endo-1,6-beta-galactosidase
MMGKPLRGKLFCGERQMRIARPWKGKTGMRLQASVWCLGVFLCCGCRTTDHPGSRPQSINDVRSVIDPTSKVGGVWRGWGVSLAWWAKKHGNRDDLADLFFTKKISRFQDQDIPGLGLTFARYLAGSQAKNPVGPNSIVVTKKMNPFRVLDGFWLSPDLKNPTEPSWDWSVDPEQRAMLLKAKERGVQDFELFSNSPMWWMLANKNPAGSADGGNNLLPEHFNNHAIYLATIAQVYRDKWNINFQSVAPFNEPLSNWWKADNNQEGCHVSPDVQEIVIQYLRDELDARGLSQTQIAVSDENSYDEAVSTWSAFSSGTKSKIGRINVHGYQESGRRDVLFQKANADAKQVWLTEYGENDASGHRLAKNILLDFQWLHATSWSYWQALDQSNWGLINDDLEKNTLGPVTNKYFVLAQFSRHIRPGMRIFDAGLKDHGIAAYDATAKKLVVVMMNTEHAQYFDVDLSRFSSVAGDNGLVRRWATTLNGTLQYRSYSDTTLKGKYFWSKFERDMIQTFEIDNVSL